MHSHYVFPKSYISKLAETARANSTYTWNQEVDEYLPAGWVRSRGRDFLMLAGYSYLGLIRNERLIRSARYALDKFGTGTHGTRPNCGTISLHTELERLISQTNRTQDTLISPSGFQANFSTIAALVGEPDVIFGDALNHASIVDGCRLSGARFVSYRHNDIDDLRAKLAQAQAYRNRLIVTDAVFSMDGDIAPIPALCQLRDDYRAILMIDEAHSLGVLGDSGFGATEHFDLAGGDVDVITGVLSKAIPGNGGYTSASREAIDYLKHNARSYIFSGSTSPYATAVAIESFKLLIHGEVQIGRLWHNTKLFHEELRRAGVNIGSTASPITPIMIGDSRRCLSAARACMDRSIYLVAMPFPVVPLGQSRLRATVTAEHCAGDLAAAAKTLAGIWREYGMESGESPLPTPRSAVPQ